jgi:hypothetical protein
MCFGNTQTQQQNTNYTPNPQVQSAADQSLSFAQNLQNQGYTAYSGPRVAPFSPLQEAGFGDAFGAVAGSNPYYQTSADYINNYATAPGTAVNPNTIASAMGPYMNQYVNMALAPQVEAQNQQFAAQDRNLNAAATSSGAFGDARAGIEAANLTNQQDIARSGLIGNAYSNAFNTAIGAGAQDVGNSLQSQMFNAQMQQAGLGRQLQGAQALQGLYGSQLADVASQYGLSAQAGGAQQQELQALMNVPYSNYLAAQQYPFMTEQLLNSAVATGAGAMPASSTSTVQQPNNSGWGLLGAIAPSLFMGGTGGFGSSALGLGLSSLGLISSDERDKEDVEDIGRLNDGQKIYRFRYKGDPSRLVHVGLMAQDVEKKHPSAVVDLAGHKMVNYDRATAFSSMAGDPEEHKKAA